MALKDLKSDLSWYTKAQKPFKDKAGRAVSPVQKPTGLMDLKSDLSYYGKNPGPYKPNEDGSDTKFTNRAQGSIAPPGAMVTGYSNDGTQVITYRSITTGNSFNINPLDTSLGFASRGAQLGAGSPFLKDTGFSNTGRYDESVKRHAVGRRRK